MTILFRIIAVPLLAGALSVTSKAETIQNTFIHFTMSDGLSNNMVTSIAGSGDGCVWIGTENGLNKYDGYEFELFIPGRRLNNVVVLPDGSISACTNNGLSIINGKSHSVSTYFEGCDVRAVAPGEGNIVFVSTDRKCFTLDLLSSAVNEFHTSGISNIHTIKRIGDKLYVCTCEGELKTFSVSDGRELASYHFDASVLVHDLIEDPDGNIWAATGGVGVVQFDSLLHVRYLLTKEKRQLPTNNVRSLSYDSDGNLWIGTSSGLAVYDPQSRSSIILAKENFNPGTLAHNSVRAVCADRSDGIWVGTYSGGVNYYHPTLARFRPIIRRKENVSFNDNIFSVIREDKDGTLWVGSNQRGIDHITKSGERIASYDFPKEVKDLFIKGSDIYIGANNSNLCRLDRRTGKITTLNGVGRNTFRIVEYTSTCLWLGTSTGIVLFDTVSGTEMGRYMDGCVFALHYDERNSNLWIGYKDSTILARCQGLQLKCRENPDLKAMKNVNQFYQDRIGQIWIASPDGLFRWNGETVEAEVLSRVKGVSSVAGIEEDDISRLWLSVGDKICSFNPQDKEVHWYFPRNGETENVYNLYSHCRTSDGDMFFGGTDGITRFSPNGISPSVMKVSPVISRVESGDMEFYPDGNLVLDQESNNLSIIFSVPDYQSNGNNLFSYFLEGYDEEWSKPSSDRKATYTHLPKGTYSFKLKAANSDMNWSDEIVGLQITIKTAWYDSLAAMFVYGVIAVLLSFLFYRLILKRNRKSQEKEIGRLKMNFLLTVSHELKTQLDDILATLPELITRTENIWSVRQLKNIGNRAEKLLKMSDQLTGGENAEGGIKQLKVREIVVFDLVNDQFKYFEDLAKRRKIQFTLSCEDKGRRVYLDGEIFSTIVGQLVAEAFQSTSSGKIDIGLSFKERSFAFFVSFNGRIISEDTLSYARKLSQAHHGVLTQTRGYNEITIKVRFPQPADEYSSEEMDSPKEWSSEELTDRGETGPQFNMNGKILVMEDNKEILEILKVKLGRYYEVISSEDGESAMGIVREGGIDAIILEEKMPAMDGTHFCLSLKQDMELCRIPIVILTGEQEPQALVNILQCGADDVMTKPFSASVLTAKVRNIVRARRFMSNEERGPLESMSLTLSTTDEEFVRKINTVILGRLSDPCLSSDDIATAMKMSRSTLYDKVKNLTGRSVLDMIHEIRFQQAVKLLKERKYQLAEISDMTGFNNPSYFSTSFKKYFGCTPSQYLKQG